MRKMNRATANHVRSMAFDRRPDATPVQRPVLAVSLGSFMREAIDSARKAHNARVLDDPMLAMRHNRDREDVASADRLSRMIRNATR